MGSDILRISGIEGESIVDGPGFRFTVFVQGCPHKCKGCHNPQTHDFSGGYDISVDELIQKFSENPLLAGMTFSGGEPFCQSAALCTLAKKVKALGKNVVCYSGYTIEQLLELSKAQPSIGELLHLADILVDGPFILELRDLSLQFRGSSNQRIINLKEFFENNSQIK